MIIHRWVKGQLVSWLALIALLSFAASVWGVAHDPSASFYLAPMRAWELALGSLLALNAFPQLRHRLGLELAGSIGLASIAWSVFSFTSATPFPGASALLPAGGAALVIYSGNSRDTAVGKVLGIRPLVFIGLISYSLYLWHWPLLVFVEAWSAYELTTTQKCAIILLAFSLATLSWKFIESPFRKPAGIIQRTALFGGVATATTCFVMFGLSGSFSHGWPGRFPRTVLELAAATDDFEFPNGLRVVANAPGGIYEINSKSNEAAEATLFFGDFHAEQYAPRVVSLVSKNSEMYNKVIFATYGSCAPIPNVFTGWNELGSTPRWARSESCEDVKKYAFSLIKDAKINTVVIAAAWNGYFLMKKTKNKRDDCTYNCNYYAVRNSRRFQFIGGAGAQVALENLENFIESIPKTIRVILILDNPADINFDPMYIIRKNRMFGYRPLNREAITKKNSDQEWVANQLKGISVRQHIEYVDPSKWYCQNSYCAIFSRGAPIYLDDNHLTASFVRNDAVDIDDLITASAFRR